MFHRFFLVLFTLFLLSGLVSAECSCTGCNCSCHQAGCPDGTHERCECSCDPEVGCHCWCSKAMQPKDRQGKTIENPWVSVASELSKQASIEVSGVSAFDILSRAGLNLEDVQVSNLSAFVSKGIDFSWQNGSVLDLLRAISIKLNSEISYFGLPIMPKPTNLKLYPRINLHYQHISGPELYITLVNFYGIQFDFLLQDRFINKFIDLKMVDGNTEQLEQEICRALNSI